jgi:hypothetical protein
MLAWQALRIIEASNALRGMMMLYTAILTGSNRLKRHVLESKNSPTRTYHTMPIRKTADVFKVLSCAASISHTCKVRILDKFNRYRRVESPPQQTVPQYREGYVCIL